MAASRYLCIHGHFYQPPRENPWLDEVEVQDSAHPYHDWNERITEECYAPNGAARLLDERGRITELVNNYGRMSFDFGPTLLSWLERAAPETYAAVLAADRESQARFGGHGSAMALPYNHPILPLLNARDRRTQVLWGVRDFEFRFGRRPEGMWLPETAVDGASLDVMAEAGIQYTVLAPHQVRRREGSPGAVDPRRPYRVALPSGRHLALFVYDAAIARAVAFEGLLGSGERLVARLAEGFRGGSDAVPQLVHLATDGETFGHHHAHGDMALAYALKAVEERGIARVTSYGEALEHLGPAAPLEVVESTSWSCAHGLERWRGDCGCGASRAEPSQAWRGPLRATLDWLRDAVVPLFERAAAGLLRDPWAARDDFISVILDRSSDAVDALLERHQRFPLAAPERVRALELLELERQCLLMYTSCAWFFADLAGIEAVQNLRYAGRALHLAEGLFGCELEGPFRDRLAMAHSNRPDEGDGRQVYDRHVRPARVGLLDVAVRDTLAALFERAPTAGHAAGFAIERNAERRAVVDRARVAVGQVQVTSRATRATVTAAYAVLHAGDLTLAGGVRETVAGEESAVAAEGVLAAFAARDFAAAFRLIETHYGDARCSLGSLFRDQQRKVASLLLAEAVAEDEEGMVRAYERRQPLLRLLTRLELPVPTVSAMAAEVVLNRELGRALSATVIDPDCIDDLLGDARATGARLDAVSLGYAARKMLEGALEPLRSAPAERSLLRRAEVAARTASRLPFHVGRWRAQNLAYHVSAGAYAERCLQAGPGDPDASEWLASLRTIGELLGLGDVGQGVVK